MFGIGAILNFIMQLSFKPFGTAFFAFFSRLRCPRFMEWIRRVLRTPWCVMFSFLCPDVNRRLTGVNT